MYFLTLPMLNKLRGHAHFYLANQITWSRLLIQIHFFTYLMTNSADPDQLASSEAK